MRPRATFVALILAGIAGLLASGLTFDGNLARLLPDSGEVFARSAKLLERVAVVDVEGDAGAAETFKRRLGYPVQELPTEGELVQIVDLLRERAACYIDDYAPLKQRLNDIPGRLRKLERQLQEPGGFGTWAARDPLGFSNEALRGLELLSAGFESARIDGDGVVSGDGRHRLVLVRPGFPTSDTKRTRDFLAAIDRASEGLSVRHLGAHRSTLDNATAIRGDATRAAIFGTLAVLLLALFVFRRPAVAILAVVPGAFGAVMALGATALFTDSVPLAAVGFACVLLGITIDFAIHVLASRVTPARAILMGATTTATAFLCLQASVVPGLRDMGTLGAIGVVCAALFAIFVLRPASRAAKLPPTRWLQSRALLIVVAVAFPFVVAGVARVKFEGDPMKMSQLSPAAAADEAAIRAVWGEAFSTVTVLVPGPTLEIALGRNDAVASELRGRSHASLSAVLPSRATQERRIRRWREFWTEERITGLGAELAAATEGTPFRSDAFEPCLAWLRHDPEPVVVADIPRSMWEARLLESDGEWIVSTPVFDPTLAPGDTTGLVINPRGLVTRLGRMVGRETLLLGLLAAGCVALVAGAWFGRVGPVVVVLLPLFASTAWTLGLLGWLNISITLANAAFVVFLFGLAIDYGIFLVEARLRHAATGEDVVEESDGAVLLCALTTCVGFGALLLATHPVLFSIGATALIGIASSVVLVQVLVPRLYRPTGGGDTIAALYRHQPPPQRFYAAGKAKSDPIVPVLRDLPPADSTLIAGCGHGIMAAGRLLRYPGASVLCIDSDARKLATAAGVLRGFANARFECADLRTADLGSHDLVTMVDLLHYIPIPEQETLARRIAAAVRPGGTLLFREGCTDRAGHRRVSRWERIALATRFTRAEGGLHFRTEQGWSTLMQSCGLEIETVGSGPGSNVIFLCRKPNN